MTQRYRTAQSLYDLVPKKETTEIWNLIDIFQDHCSLYNVSWGENTRVSLKIYSEYVADGAEDIWELYSVWLDQQPFMIVQRYGKNSAKVLITNKELFLETVSYLRSLSEEELPFPVMDPNQEADHIDAFGSFSLSELYDPQFSPSFKEGDVVDAQVAIEKKYGYIFKDTLMASHKVCIQRVDITNRHDTYQGIETERKYVGKGKERRIVPASHPETGESIYVHLNEHLRQVR